MNNSTVDLVTTEKAPTKKLEEIKPVVITTEENDKSLDVPKKVASKTESPKSTPKKAPAPAQKPKTPAPISKTPAK